MNLRSAPSDSLIDILDRVLDKSIVIEAWTRMHLLNAVSTNWPVHAAVSLQSVEVREGYGEDARSRELFSDLFPYWSKDLWTK
jgi:hypothetical protein